ncbi:hypothetical protein, partial [Selenomonas ruminantium]|uniref:hypothetical protein n=1 Tax=Selenomonas ruminantium TaxID=971 RepID=UPI001B7FE3F8
NIFLRHRQACQKLRKTSPAPPGLLRALHSGDETKEGRGGNGFRQRLTSLSKQTKVIDSPSLRLVARTAGENLTKIA